MDLSAPINAVELIGLYLKFILQTQSIGKVLVPINDAEMFPSQTHCFISTLTLMAQCILDLLAGDVKSFLVLGVISVTLQGIFGL